MRPRSFRFAVGFALVLGAGAVQAQTNFPEVEPNSVKAEATVVGCLAPGDTISGISTGTGTVPGDTSDASRDFFRLRTCALPPGIYRHRLVLSHPLPDSMVAAIRGLDQLNGTIGTVDTILQNLNASTGNGRFLEWYGFGRSEELYVRVGGAAATTAPYTLTLETVAVVASAVPGTFQPGNVTLQGIGTADSMVRVYDASFAPILGYVNDDVGTFATPFSLTRAYAPGSYYLAVSVFGSFNEQPFAPDDHTYAQPTFAVDFPDSLVRLIDPNGISTAPYDHTFQVSDATTTATVLATQATEIELLWFRIDVLDPTPATPVCLGDGSGTACPCGNDSAPAEQAGCAHSFGTGGRLTGAGAASVGADTFVLTGTAMPNSSALYFQGTTQLGGGLGVSFGDGLRCAGGTVTRLGTKTNVGGTSSYPGPGDQSVSVRGMVPPAGGTRTYQCWYRNAAAFCTASTFNLTNGIETTWIP